MDRPADVALGPQAVATIREILARGQGVEMAVRGGRLVIWETGSKKRYEATARGQTP